LREAKGRVEKDEHQSGVKGFAEIYGLFAVEKSQPNRSQKNEGSKSNQRNAELANQKPCVPEVGC